MVPPSAGKYSPGDAYRSESGFTLIEMIAAIGLSALLLGVLAQFTYSIAGLWSRNDQAYRRQYVLRSIEQTLYQDFSVAYSSPYLPEPALKGNEYEVTFWQETNAGLVRVRYNYDSANQTVYRSSGFWGDQSEAAVLFQEVIDWRFEYFQVSTKNWLIEWEPEQPTELPSLIRLTVRTKLGAAGPFTVPARSWHPEVDVDELSR